MASWLVPSTAATSEPGKSQTVLLTWYVRAACFLLFCFFVTVFTAKICRYPAFEKTKKKTGVTKSVNPSGLKCGTADPLTWYRHVCFKRAKEHAEHNFYMSKQTYLSCLAD